MGDQCQSGREGRCFGHDLEMVAVGPAGNRTGNVAGRFAPVAGDRAGRIICAGAQVKVEAVAGAANVELKFALVAEDVVSCAASNLFMCTARKLDCTGTGPLPCQSLKRRDALRKTSPNNEK